ncbi:MAG: ankyrin repeat domain-containing protein [Candidatus Babeliales bacterium]|nr:ankyrin repeat domain-containing protein [Candidatus Babeliales bacterium]
MILKMNPCHSVVLFCLFFSPHFLQCSHKDFRTRLHLEVITQLPAESIQITKALVRNHEHLIKKALYNNHHLELKMLLNPTNVNMVLPPDAQSHHAGETLLIYACRIKDDGEFPNPQTVSLLLEKGADPLLPDRDGNTAISVAQSQGNHEIVECFNNVLKKEADASDASASKKPLE